MVIMSVLIIDVSNKSLVPKIVNLQVKKRPVLFREPSSGFPDPVSSVSHSHVPLTLIG